MIQLICEQGADSDQFKCLVNRWSLSHHQAATFALVLTKQHLALRKLDECKVNDIVVDFTTKTLAYRRRFGGGCREAIAKAVGIRKNYHPTVVDATAGLGRDAFVLASLGCDVTLFERHPVVCALLDDGIMRAYADPDIGTWMQERMHLIPKSRCFGLDFLATKPDIVYLDPMFPPRQKRALIKKEMRYFQLLVGSDHDADQLLSIGCRLAKKRVVVKRPIDAPFLAHKKPEFAVSTKNHRFDVYVNHASV